MTPKTHVPKKIAQPKKNFLRNGNIFLLDHVIRMDRRNVGNGIKVIFEFHL